MAILNDYVIPFLCVQKLQDLFAGCSILIQDAIQGMTGIGHGADHNILTGAVTEFFKNLRHAVALCITVSNK